MFNDNSVNKNITSRYRDSLVKNFKRYMPNVADMQKKVKMIYITDIWEHLKHLKQINNATDIKSQSIRNRCLDNVMVDLSILLPKPQYE